MRILHVIASACPEGGGPIEGVCQRGKELTDLGHTIEIACCDPPSSPWLSGIPFIVHAMGPSTGKYLLTHRLSPWLLHNASKFDGVVVNGLWQFHSYATWQAMRACKKPYVLFTHGMLDPWFKKTYRLKHCKKLLYWLAVESRVIRDAEYVLFTSEEERLLARHSFWPYAARERVVRYGVRGPDGDREQQRETFFAHYPELRAKRLLLFLGRIHPKKGCDLLIQAFANIAHMDANLHLVMAGPDQHGWRKELELMAGKARIAHRISWPGMIKGDLKWGAYHACAAFVLPSHQENFGIAVAEALACQKPVLISNRVNIWREVERHNAGWIADDTASGISVLLAKWLADSRKSEELGRNARLCFETAFDVHGSATDLLGILRGLK